MFATGKAGHKLISRGDFDSIDFNETDFTFDNTWRALDLSGIVPSNAKFVLMFLVHQSGTEGAAFKLAGSGISNYENIFYLESRPIQTDHHAECILNIDSTGVIQYKGEAQTNPIIALSVLGWFV